MKKYLFNKIVFNRIELPSNFSMFVFNPGFAWKYEDMKTCDDNLVLVYQIMY